MFRDAPLRTEIVRDRQLLVIAENAEGNIRMSDDAITLEEWDGSRRVLYSFDHAFRAGISPFIVAAGGGGTRFVVSEQRGEVLKLEINPARASLVTRIRRLDIGGLYRIEWVSLGDDLLLVWDMGALRLDEDGLVTWEAYPSTPNWQVKDITDREIVCGWMFEPADPRDELNPEEFWIDLENGEIRWDGLMLKGD